MRFTFGFITAGDSDDTLNMSIDSIEKFNIPEYEILIVGNSKIVRNKIKIIPFNENIRKAWITKKKNLITHHAQYDNIIYSHDYVVFEPDWYEGFIKFGDNFKICMTKFINPDGSRFRDWVLWHDNRNFMDEIVGKDREGLIPYDMTHLSKYQYISGSYWVAKKDIMKEFPLDESLCWGQGEDVVWSQKVRMKYDFSMNPYSTVKTLKYKHPCFNIATEKTIEKLKTIR